MPYFSSIPTLNNPMTPALPVRLDRQNAGRLPSGYGTGREQFQRSLYSAARCVHSMGEMRATNE